MSRQSSQDSEESLCGSSGSISNDELVEERAAPSVFHDQGYTPTADIASMH